MSGLLALNGPAEFLLELRSAATGAAVDPPPWGMAGGLPLAARPEELPVPEVNSALLRLSRWGWIGEPGDTAAPNTAYPARLTAPPSLTWTLPILPENDRRGTATAGTVTLDNADGGLSIIGGDWSMAGRTALLRRGPYRSPLRADSAAFATVAALRVGSAAMGTDALTVELISAAADLAVPVCGTYAGTGGAEGDATLKGQNRPLLLGIGRNIEPVLVLSGKLLYQVSAQALYAVTQVRDKGAALTIGSNYATAADLLAATVGAGTVATCLAAGMIRTGSTPQGPLTLDAQSAADSNHGGIALALLRGPGGLAEDRLVAAAFTALPAGPAGFLFPDGTVADALNRVLASCAGWWGTDRQGRLTAGRLAVPEQTQAAFRLERWMLDEAADRTGRAIQEVAGSVPRYGARVKYGMLARTQAASEVVASAPAYGDAAAMDYLAKGYKVGASIQPAIQSQFPTATSPEPLDSGWANEAEATAQAAYLVALHGVRRRFWQVPVGQWGHQMALGMAVGADHPLLANRTWIVQALEGEGDLLEATLWG